VMRDDPQWSDKRREEALARESPTRVALVRPIRVFILYGTALANEDGRVQFFDDLYAQDAPLIAKLSERHSHAAGARAVL
jgi:L,D-transpeptidase YcbB